MPHYPITHKGHLSYHCDGGLLLHYVNWSRLIEDVLDLPDYDLPRLAKALSLSVRTLRQVKHGDLSHFTPEKGEELMNIYRLFYGYG